MESAQKTLEDASKLLSQAVSPFSGSFSTSFSPDTGGREKKRRRRRERKGEEERRRGRRGDEVVDYEQVSLERIFNRSIGSAICFSHVLMFTCHSMYFGKLFLKLECFVEQ